MRQKNQGIFGARCLSKCSADMLCEVPKLGPHACFRRDDAKCGASTNGHEELINPFFRSTVTVAVVSMKRIKTGCR